MATRETDFRPAVILSYEAVTPIVAGVSPYSSCWLMFPKAVMNWLEHASGPVVEVVRFDPHHTSGKY
jgi:hypothetical protein